MAKKKVPPSVGSPLMPGEAFEGMVGPEMAKMYHQALDSEEVQVAFMVTLAAIAGLVESIAEAVEDDLQKHWDVMTARGMGDLLAEMSAFLYRPKNGGEKGGEHDA